jgi:hypothetical protein
MIQPWEQEDENEEVSPCFLSLLSRLLSLKHSPIQHKVTMWRRVPWSPPLPLLAVYPLSLYGGVGFLSPYTRSWVLQSPHLVPSTPTIRHTCFLDAAMFFVVFHAS